MEKALLKPLKILFFVDGTAPTPDDFNAARSINGATVVFRNAKCVPADATALEDCDGVAGKVPAVYAAKYPAAEDALQARAEKIAAQSAKIGDSPAPKPPAKAKTDPPPTKAPAPASAPPAPPAAGWKPNA